MILLSVEGNESLYDSDQLDAVATVTDVPEKCIVLQESTDQTENVVGVDGVVIETDTADAPYRRAWKSSLQNFALNHLENFLILFGCPTAIMNTF